MSDRPPRRIDSNDDRKTCWVCFATVEDDRTAPWVQPCRCRGTSKWVHQVCLQRWIDEKQKGNVTTKVACPQCNAEYIIEFPRLGPMLYILDLCDWFLYKVSPFCAIGVTLVSVYWTLVTYGAISVMQVLGHKEGLHAMEDNTDPLFLLIVLPAIPIMLTLGKMIRWEDYVLRLWRKHSQKIGVFKYLFGSSDDEQLREPAETTSSFSDVESFTRLICGALIMPTVATMSGKLLFKRVSSNFQRTLLGGIAFIAIKGVAKLYYKQQQYVRQAKRQIRNFEESTAQTTEL